MTRGVIAARRRWWSLVGVRVPGTLDVSEVLDRDDLAGAHPTERFGDDECLRVVAPLLDEPFDQLLREDDGADEHAPRLALPVDAVEELGLAELSDSGAPLAGFDRERVGCFRLAEVPGIAVVDIVLGLVEPVVMVLRYSPRCPFGKRHRLTTALNGIGRRLAGRYLLSARRLCADLTKQAGPPLGARSARHALSAFPAAHSRR